MIKVKVNNEYKDVVKIFCGGTLQKEIIKVWSREAQEYVYESSVEYTGSLPITITADGNALLDYRIYGTDGGVGVATENLFDESTVESGGYIDPNSGNFVSHDAWSLSDYIKVTGDYINLSGKALYIFISRAIIHNFYDSNKSWLGGAYTMQGGGTIGERESKSVSISGVSYVRVSYRPAIFDDIMLVEGSTAPTSYIPYGYKLPMTVGDGNTAQTVPVYIGDTQLEDDEYVDFGEQKVYKQTENLATMGAAETKTKDGVTITCDGKGTYTLSGTAEKDGRIDFDVPTFRMPDVNDTDFKVCFFNSQAIPIVYYGWALIMNGINRVVQNIALLSNAEVRRIGFTYTTNFVFDCVLSPSVTIGSAVPSQFVPHIAPTDPPVPLPKIPTIDGTTTIDYDGTPKPSQMYVKYRR